MQSRIKRERDEIASPHIESSNFGDSDQDDVRNALVHNLECERSGHHVADRRDRPSQQMIHERDLLRSHKDIERNRGHQSERERGHEESPYLDKTRQKAIDDYHNDATGKEASSPRGEYSPAGKSDKDKGNPQDHEYGEVRILADEISAITENTDF